MSNVEQRLIALNHLEGVAGLLAPYLADTSRHVVAKAAGRVRDELVSGVEAELRAGLARMFDSEAEDPDCLTSLVLLEALDAVGHDDPHPFFYAANLFRYVRDSKGPVDIATDVRARGAAGLVRLAVPGVLELLTRHLTDKSRVQANAARCLARHGDPAGFYLVQLRLAMGADDFDVRTECYTTLLLLDQGGAGLAKVKAALNSRDPTRRHAAALALGESGVDGAFELLRAWLESASKEDDREAGLTALRFMRSDAARDYLRKLDAGS